MSPAPAESSMMDDQGEEQVQYGDDEVTRQTNGEPPVSSERRGSRSSGDGGRGAGGVGSDKNVKNEGVGSTETSSSVPAPQQPSENGSAKRENEDKQDHEMAHDDPQDSRATLYIRNLPIDFRNEQFRSYVERFGEVVTCRVVMNPVNKDSRGFGFATFISQEIAEDVMSRLNGAELNGKRLRVERAKRSRPHDPTPGEYKGPTGASVKYDHRGRLKPGYTPYWCLPVPRGSSRYDTPNDEAYQGYSRSSLPDSRDHYDGAYSGSRATEYSGADRSIRSWSPRRRGSPTDWAPVPPVPAHHERSSSSRLPPPSRSAAGPVYDPPSYHHHHHGAPPLEPPPGAWHRSHHPPPSVYDYPPMPEDDRGRYRRRETPYDRPIRSRSPPPSYYARDHRFRYPERSSKSVTEATGKWPRQSRGGWGEPPPRRESDHRF